MSKILKKINLVVGETLPKRVTWSLDKSGTGYEKIEDEMDNNFETYLPDNAIESVKTKKETEGVFDLYLTDNGIPWIQPKKETESKSGSNIQDTENPKFTTEELRCENQTNLEIIRSMQESIDFKSKIIKKAVIKSKNKVLDIIHCRFTPEELAREKQADVEARRRLKEIMARVYYARKRKPISKKQKEKWKLIKKKENKKTKKKSKHGKIRSISGTKNNRVLEVTSTNRRKVKTKRKIR